MKRKDIYADFKLKKTFGLFICVKIVQCFKDKGD